MKLVLVREKVQKGRKSRLEKKGKKASLQKAGEKWKNGKSRLKCAVERQG